MWWGTLRARRASLALGGAAALTAVFPAGAGSGTPCAAASHAGRAPAIRCFINAERGVDGLHAVRATEALRSAAAAHSAEMVAQGYFDHVSPAGVGIEARVRATGYLRHAYDWKLGEALGYAGTGATGPRDLMAALLASPTHREILLDPRFRDFGVGVAPGVPVAGGPSPGFTVTLDFGWVARPAAARSRR